MKHGRKKDSARTSAERKGGKINVQQHQFPQNPYRGALITIAVLAVIAVIVLLLRNCDGSPLNKETDTSDTQNPGIVYDSGAVVGGWDEADVDKIVDSLNEKVEEGMINISMNTTHTFSDGTSAGNVMIVNEGVNNYPQVVEIVRNDNNATIYKSGAIPVGSKIETAMSVNVPTAFPMAMAQNGDVTTATDCKIINNSYGPVRVKSVTINAANGWKLTAFGDKSTLANEKVDANKWKTMYRQMRS